MNILELDSFNLADTVKFHDRLNPRLWDRSEHLRPEVHAKLVEIARDFQEFLGVPDLDVKDITISGSNAAYNYTPTSDIDLHLVVDLPEADNNEVYRELFDAKKFQYNNIHNIKIGGYDVELYVQNPNEEHHSQGIYSLLRNAWVSVPKRRKAEIDDISTKSKYEDLAARIDDTVNSGNHDSMAALMKKIKAMRQNSLDKHGELGADNLAFKLLRNNGYIKKLVDARNAARDRELSLAELAKPKQRVTYGFMSESPDGVNPTTKMFLEEPGSEDEATVREFIDFVADRLGITQMPEIVLHTDPEWSQQNKSFGRYTPETHTLEVNLANRHVMDILRTTAHELVHCRQNQESQLPGEAGKTGSKWENQAHAIAGVIMRDYADHNPAMFENASGYIPKNKREARDPRYSMAVSADVGPGQVGKEANKLGLQTGKNGEPGSLMNPAKKLAESLYRELQIFEEQDLMEIKMTGKNLSKLAAAIPGATVGLEFEMIVPNVNSPGNEDLEPDMDQDERVRDIDDIVNFFDDGDYNGRNEIRRLRETLEDEYQTWVTEGIDQEWYDNGMEFFQEFLDREYPFDRDDAFEEARDEIITANPDLPQESEEFQQLVSARVDEMEANYYVDQWEEQGRYYDYAREEFEDEQRDNYSESDWLSNRGWRYASDVHTEYPVVSWPYWTSPGGDDTDAKQVALDFMNFMGYNTIAVGDYHGYGGGYELWDGDQWKKIGSNKPMDAFTVEPDGSLSGDDAGDTGLEFVSPPIPLAQIGDTMAKVQAWAAQNGVYTGKGNGTALHTNISIPGYSIDKLDYLKAALLLGDEYVLRDFDRITNTYAKPAIDKIKELVRSKPEKAQELLDKMKSQLNAEASKLIHSGSTDKYTSINTKDNRIEFRSPGGDYLSIIADNPQKMVDTINRMVVTLDAAMDPNKYKEEYQKKLYKLLTGQTFGRESRTGAKQEMKQDDKDLLNIFSRYAAGELPKAALKSFVRQAQLQRKVAKEKEPGKKYWWNVQWDNNRRMEVVAGSKEVAKQVAAEEWGVPESQLAGAVVTPLRPYEEKPATAQPAQTQTGNWGIWIGANERFANQPGTYARGETPPLYRFSSRAAAELWIEQQRAERPGMRTDIEVREIEPSTPIPGSTLDLQRQRAAQAQEIPEVPLDIEIAQPSKYELYRVRDGRAVEVNGQPIQFNAVNQDDAESKIDRYVADFNLPRESYSVRSVLQVPAQQDNWSQDFERRMQHPAPVETPAQFGAGTADAAQGGIVDVSNEQPAPQTGGQFTGEWKVLLPDGREVYRFSGVGNSQADANRVAAVWLRNNGMGVSGEGFEVVPVMG